MSKKFKFAIDITCGSCVKSIENALDHCESIKIKSYSTDVVLKTITIIVDEHIPQKNNTLPIAANSDGVKKEMDSQADKAIYTYEDMSKTLTETIDGTGIGCTELSYEDVLQNEDEWCDEFVEDTEPTVSTSQETVIQPQQTAQDQLRKKRQVIRSHLIKGAIGSIFGIGMIALMLSGWAIPLYLMYALMAGSSLLTLLLGADSYYDAGKKLVKSGTLTMDTLFTVSTLTLVGVSIASCFVPGLPMMMEGGLLIFGFRHLGKAMEESIKDQVSSGLVFKDRAAKRVRKKVSLDNRMGWDESETNAIAINDIIRVARGDVIPVDGICETDETRIYKTIITGATLPCSIKKGERIYAGMKVPEEVDFIDIKVKRLPSRSYLARLDNKIEQTNSEKSPIESKANDILQYFIPGVLGLAAISGVVVGCLFNPALAIQCAISVLVSACPCTLGFVTPFAVKVGMTKALENGVRFKSSTTLQSADDIDAVVFDLNGTLTTGVPEVVDYQICSQSQMGPDEFFSFLAAIEKEAPHPIANAIFNYANAKAKASNRENTKVSHVDTTNHSGIRAVVNGENCLVGNIDFLKANHIDLSDIDPEKKSASQTVYFVKNNKIMGNVQVKDPLRPDALLTIQELRRMGKDVYICTGADEETAKRYAKELTIPVTHVYANCLGSSDSSTARTKVKFIESLQAKNKRVAMIGDAGNDALAITTSDFGIAVKSHSGDAGAQAQAGAVVDNASLLPIVTAFAVAKETVHSIKQNLIISLTYNTGMMVLTGGILIAFGFALNPAVDVALMVLQSGLLLANQYRIKHQTLPHLKLFEQQMQLGKKSNSTTYHSFKQNGLMMRHKQDLEFNAQPSPPSSPRLIGPERQPLILKNDYSPSYSFRVK